MSFSTSRVAIIGACAIVCVAALAQAQYNTYDSDSASELGKLVRGSGKSQQGRGYNSAAAANAAAAAAAAAASRDIHSQSQPMQYAPTQHRRNFGPSAPSPMSGYGPTNLGAAASNGRSNANNDDDDEGSNFGPNFGANFDSNNNDEGNENSPNGGSNADGPVTNLNQAASGYPGHHHNQGEFNGNEGLNFDGQGAFGPSSVDTADFGPSEGGYGSSEGRRHKSASSPMGSRGFGGEEDAGAPQYGPNSAINADGDVEVESGRGQAGSNYGPQADNDDNDDE